MNNRNNNTRPQSRPTSANKPVKPAAKTKKSIAFTRTIYSMPEGKRYVGRIVECDIIDTKKGERLILKIRPDRSNLTFCTSFKYPLVDYSPLNDLLSKLDKDGDCTVELDDLIGQQVEFTTKISDEGFCNIKSIDIFNPKMAQADDEETEGEDEEDEDDDTDEDEEEDEDLDSFFEESEED